VACSQGRLALSGFAGGSVSGAQTISGAQVHKFYLMRTFRNQWFPRFYKINPTLFSLPVLGICD
jgi:hypothetical protein